MPVLRLKGPPYPLPLPTLLGRCCLGRSRLPMTSPRLDCLWVLVRVASSNRSNPSRMTSQSASAIWRSLLRPRCCEHRLGGLYSAVSKPGVSDA